MNANLSRCTVTLTSIYHDIRPPERQFITMHGHLNINLSRFTVTLTSIYHDARPSEHQFITMHGHLNINLSRFTVTLTSIYHDSRPPEHQFITMHGHLNVRCLNSFRTIRCVCQEQKQLRTNKQLIHLFTNEHVCYNKPCTSGVSILI